MPAPAELPFASCGLQWITPALLFGVVVWLADRRIQKKHAAAENPPEIEQQS